MYREDTAYHSWVWRSVAYPRIDHVGRIFVCRIHYCLVCTFQNGSSKQTAEYESEIEQRNSKQLDSTVKRDTNFV